MKRRDFIKSTAVALSASTLLNNLTLAAPIATGKSDRLGPLLPMRPLGKTGEKLTLFCLGGAHVGRMEEAAAQRQIEYALEQGVRFFDNAYIYSRGRAEEYYGKFLCSKYREDVYVMTKANANTAEEVENQVNTSLERMKTDYIDLLYVHMIASIEDVDTRVGNGCLDMVRKFQEEGKVRHLGVSCHTNVGAALHFLDLIKEDDFICCLQSPINAVDAATPGNSFTRMVLPEVVKRGHSHIAMKTLGGGGLVGGSMSGNRKPPGLITIPDRISLEENFHFVLSQPITSWVSGTDSLEQLKQNIGFARSFSHLTEGDKKAIVQKVAGLHTDKLVESYKTETA
ncbi:MAG: aldo/keto reductase [Opitutae bacterium]|nr:aldo/keto reductase [Opitutae bacterium]MBC9888834.1 aldo/keto reductase [Opitutae bacterium]